MSLLQRSLTGSVLILCIVAVRALALHRLPKTTFLVLWVMAALRLLLPVALPLPHLRTMGMETWPGSLPKLTAGLSGHPANVSADPTAKYHTAVLALWLVGCLLSALYFTVSYLRSMRKFRTSLPDSTPYVRTWLASHQILRPLTVRSSDRIVSPLTYGILRPVILLPKSLRRDDEATLRYVLTHELIHIRRFDAVTKLLFAAVLCIHWLNPLVWVLYVLANRDMELSCDARVLRHTAGGSRSAYALTLLQLEETKSGLLQLCSHFSKNAVTERIESIMHYKKPLPWH